MSSEQTFEQLMKQGRLARWEQNYADAVAHYAAAIAVATSADDTQAATMRWDEAEVFARVGEEISWLAHVDWRDKSDAALLQLLPLLHKAQRLLREAEQDAGRNVEVLEKERSWVKTTLDQAFFEAKRRSAEYAKTQWRQAEPLLQVLATIRPEDADIETGLQLVQRAYEHGARLDDHVQKGDSAVGERRLTAAAEHYRTADNIARRPDLPFQARLAEIRPRRELIEEAQAIDSVLDSAERMLNGERDSASALSYATDADRLINRLRLSAESAAIPLFHNLAQQFDTRHTTIVDDAQDRQSIQELIEQADIEWAAGSYEVARNFLQIALEKGAGSNVQDRLRRLDGLIESITTHVTDIRTIWQERGLDEARIAFREETLKSNPGNPRLRLLFHQLYSECARQATQAENYQAAHRYYAKLAAFFEDDNSLLRLRDTAEDSAKIARILESATNSFGTNATQNEYETDQQVIKQALDIISAGEEIGRDYHSLSVRVRARADQIDDALQRMREAETFRNLGQQAFKQRRLTQAERHYRTALSHWSGDEQAQRGLFAVQDEQDNAQRLIEAAGKQQSTNSFEEAVDQLHSAASAWVDRDDIKQQQAEILIEWAEYLLATDDQDSASRRLHQAEALATATQKTQIATLTRKIESEPRLKAELSAFQEDFRHVRDDPETKSSFLKSLAQRLQDNSADAKAVNSATLTAYQTLRKQVMARRQVQLKIDELRQATNRALGQGDWSEGLIRQRELLTLIEQEQLATQTMVAAVQTLEADWQAIRQKVAEGEGALQAVEQATLPTDIDAVRTALTTAQNAFAAAIKRGNPYPVPAAQTGQTQWEQALRRVEAAMKRFRAEAAVAQAQQLFTEANDAYQAHAFEQSLNLLQQADKQLQVVPTDAVAGATDLQQVSTLLQDKARLLAEAMAIAPDQIKPLGSMVNRLSSYPQQDAVLNAVRGRLQKHFEEGRDEAAEKAWLNAETYRKNGEYERSLEELETYLEYASDKRTAAIDKRTQVLREQEAVEHAQTLLDQARRNIDERHTLPNTERRFILPALRRLQPLLDTESIDYLQREFFDRVGTIVPNINDTGKDNVEQLVSEHVQTAQKVIIWLQQQESSYVLRLAIEILDTWSTCREYVIRTGARDTAAALGNWQNMLHQQRELSLPIANLYPQFFAFVDRKSADYQSRLVQALQAGQYAELESLLADADNLFSNIASDDEIWTIYHDARLDPDGIPNAKEQFEAVRHDTHRRLPDIQRLIQEIEAADQLGRVVEHRSEAISQLRQIIAEARLAGEDPLIDRAQRRLVRLESDIINDTIRTVRRLRDEGKGILDGTKSSAECDQAVAKFQQAQQALEEVADFGQENGQVMGLVTTIEAWLASAKAERDGRHALEQSPPDYETATQSLQQAYAARPNRHLYSALQGEVNRLAKEAEARQQREKSIRVAQEHIAVRAYKDAIITINAIPAASRDSLLNGMFGFARAGFEYTQANQVVLQKQDTQYAQVRQQLDRAEGLLATIAVDSLVDDVAQLQREIVHCRSRLTEDEENRKRVRRAKRQAHAYAQQGEYARALQELDIQDAPDDVEEMRKRIRDERIHVTKASKAYDTSDYSGVLTQLANIVNPLYKSRVAELRNRAEEEQKADTSLRQIEGAIQSFDVQKAEHTFDQLDTLPSLSPKTKQQMERLRIELAAVRAQIDEWRKYLQEGRKRSADLNFEGAQSMFEQARQEAKTDTLRQEAKRELDEVQKSRVKEKRQDELVKSGSRALARHEYREALDFFNEAYKIDLETKHWKKAVTKRRETTETWARKLVNDADALLRQSADIERDYQQIKDWCEQVHTLEPKVNLKERREIESTLDKALFKWASYVLDEADKVLQSAETPDECEVAQRRLNKLDALHDQLPTEVLQRYRRILASIEPRKIALATALLEAEWQRQLDVAQHYFDDEAFTATIESCHNLERLMEASDVPSGLLLKRVIDLREAAQRELDERTWGVKQARLEQLLREAEAVYPTTDIAAIAEVKRALLYIDELLAEDPQNRFSVTNDAKVRKRMWEEEVADFHTTRTAVETAIEHIRGYETGDALVALHTIDTVAPRLAERVTVVERLARSLETAINAAHSRDGHYAEALNAYGEAQKAAEWLGGGLLRELEIEDQIERVRRDWIKSLLDTARQALERNDLETAHDALNSLTDRAAAGNLREVQTLSQRYQYLQAIAAAEAAMTHLPMGVDAALMQFERARSIRPSNRLDTADQPLADLAQAVHHLTQGDLTAARRGLNRVKAEADVSATQLAQAEALLVDAEKADKAIADILERADVVWTSSPDFETIVNVITEARRKDPDSGRVQQYTARAIAEIERNLQRTNWRDVQQFEQDLERVRWLQRLAEDARQAEYSDLYEQIFAERNQLGEEAYRQAENVLHSDPTSALTIIADGLRLDPDNHALQQLQARAKRRQQTVDQLREHIAKAEHHQSQSLLQALQDIYAAQVIDNEFPAVVATAGVLLDNVDKRMMGELGGRPLRMQRYRELLRLQEVAQGVALNLQSTEAASEDSVLGSAEKRTLYWRDSILGHQKHYLAAAHRRFGEAYRREDVGQGQYWLREMQQIDANASLLSAAEQRLQSLVEQRDGLQKTMAAGWQAIGRGTFQTAANHFGRAERDFTHHTIQLWEDYAQLMNEGIISLSDPDELGPYGEAITRFQDALALVTRDRYPTRLWGQGHLTALADARTRAAAWLLRAREMQASYDNYLRIKDNAHSAATIREARKIVIEIRAQKTSVPSLTDPAVIKEVARVWQGEAKMSDLAADLEPWQPLPRREHSPRSSTTQPDAIEQLIPSDITSTEYTTSSDKGNVVDETQLPAVAEDVRLTSTVEIESLNENELAYHEPSPELADADTLATSSNDVDVGDDDEPSVDHSAETSDTTSETITEPDTIAEIDNRSPIVHDVMVHPDSYSDTTSEETITEPDTIAEMDNGEPIVHDAMVQSDSSDDLRRVDRDTKTDMFATEEVAPTAQEEESESGASAYQVVSNDDTVIMSVADVQAELRQGSDEEGGSAEKTDEQPKKRPLDAIDALLQLDDEAFDSNNFYVPDPDMWRELPPDEELEDEEGA